MGGKGGKIRRGGKSQWAETSEWAENRNWRKIGMGRKLEWAEIGMGGIESGKIGMGEICRFLDNGPFMVENRG